MQLLNLIALTLRRIFTPAPKASVRPTMIIPSLRDLRDGRQAATVQSQCQQCAKQLAGRLYVWPKPFPGKATVKSWSTDTQSFIGMTIEDFANFVMANFTLKTSDGKEFLLDRCIASLIWAACVEEDSPLPEASWQVEMDRKRKAAR